MEKEAQQNESRWFLVSHNCGCRFAIDSKRFYSAADASDKDLVCPNCFSPISKGSLMGLFEKYRLVIQKLRDEGCEIREVPDSEEKLELFLKMMCSRKG